MFSSYQAFRRECMCTHEPRRGDNNVTISKYYLLDLWYRHGVDDVEVLDEFTLEGCEMESKYGITKVFSQDKDKSNYKITAKLYPFYRKDDKDFVTVMNDIRDSAFYILLHHNKSIFGNRFHKDCMTEQMNGPIGYERDRYTREITNDKTCHIVFKLVTDKTIFTDLDGNPIPWSSLTNTYMKFIPVFRLKHINVGTGPVTIRVELVKAVVTYVQAEKYDQSVTIANFKEKRPNSANILRNNLARIANRNATKENDVSNTVEHMCPSNSICHPSLI